MNFDKYKNRLIEYLRIKGIKAERGLVRCFNPEHEDRNPSCELFDDHFVCYSGNCGIHGDIYDAVGILEGITDKKEQFKAVEAAFGSGYTPIKQSEKQTAKKETFTPDDAACAAFEKYLAGNKKSENQIRSFLQTRANVTRGSGTNYPSGIVDNLVKYFFYWPGYDIASAEAGIAVLRGAGVPLPHPQKGYSSWQHSGVVIKLGSGYKLHY